MMRLMGSKFTILNFFDPGYYFRLFIGFTFILFPLFVLLIDKIFYF